MRHLLSLMVLTTMLLGLLTGCDSKGDRSAPSGKKKIAVIPKGLTHDHWKSVEAGARKAAAEAGDVEIVWKGPPKEDDTRQQIELVQSFVSSGIDGIVLAPLSDTALVSPVQMAAGAGIPVIIIDSSLNARLGKDFISYVSTPNEKGGELAGRYLAEIMNKKGTVMLLRYAESSAATREREQGFINALKETAPDIQLIDPPRYAGADVNSAKQAAENMLTAYEGKFDGIFCPNESSTAGMLLALEDRQLAGKIKFVGFDFRELLIAAMKEGKLQGLVVQNPFQMGYQSVKAMVDHFAGKPVQEYVDTGVVLITPDNMNEPEIQREFLYKRSSQQNNP